MKILHLCAFACIYALSFSPSAFAEETAMTLEDKLNQRKTEFSKQADEHTKEEFEKGVQMVTESGALEKAKQVGDTAPDFTLPNAAGEDITLSHLLKSGPVVMIWYRGEWCPYCNIQLEDIQSHIDEFNELGAQVVAISPETPDNGWTMTDKLSLEFHVLSDVKSKIAEEYGVVYQLPENISELLLQRFDLHGRNADERNLLPLAAAYVIEEDGTISYAYLDGDYRKRAETTDIIAHLKTNR